MVLDIHILLVSPKAPRALSLRVKKERSDDLVYDFCRF